MGTHVASDALRIQAPPSPVDHVRAYDRCANELRCWLGLIEDDKSAVASVMCVVAPVCNPLADKCPLVLGQYLRSVLQL